MTTRILVCGGRDFADKALLYASLDRIAPHSAPDELGNSMPFGVTIIQGACPTGADLFADCWAVVNWCVSEEYPADWKKHGRAAGPIRNREMLASGKPDMVVAFAGGRGTKNMVDQARAARIPVRQPTWENLLGT